MMIFIPGKVWHAKGFFPGLKTYRGVFEVFGQNFPWKFCPNCGADVNIEEHEIIEIECEEQAMKVSSECQLGCGHSVWMA